MSDVLDLDSRRQLYFLLRAHPGLHLREIQRRSGLAMGATEYHLQALEKAKLVRVHQDARKRFFSVDVPATDRAALAILRQRVPRHILIMVLGADAKFCTRSELVRAAQVAASTVHYPATKLVAEGLLATGTIGRERTYRVSDGQRNRMVRLLVTYRSTLLDRLVDRFLDTTGALQ